MPRNNKSEVRTNVLFSREDHERIKKVAARKGISFAELIRNAVHTHVLVDPENSAFFNPPVFKGRKGTPRDLAENHDKYLYGKKK